MPYISQEERVNLDKLITDLAFRINTLGQMNYVITKLLLSTQPTRYGQYVEALGTLEAVKLELYRKRLAPYEDGKAMTNGEVYW